MAMFYLFTLKQFLTLHYWLLDFSSTVLSNSLNEKNKFYIFCVKIAKLPLIQSKLDYKLLNYFTVSAQIVNY